MIYIVNRNNGACLFRNTNDNASNDNSAKHFVLSALFFVSFFMFAYGILEIMSSPVHTRTISITHAGRCNPEITNDDTNNPPAGHGSP